MISYYHSDKLLRRMFLGEPYTRVTSVKIILYKSDDPPALDGTGGTPLGSGHVAKTVNMDVSNWTVTGLTATNDNIITGTTNGTLTVTATHAAIWTLTDLLLDVVELTAPIEVPSGQPFQIPAGGIDWTLSGGWCSTWGNKVLDHIITGAAITWPTSYEHILVNPAGTASVAGTPITGTSYAPFVSTVGTDDFAIGTNEDDGDPQITNATTFAFVNAGSDWTDPEGHEILNEATGERCFFLDYGTTVPINDGNGVSWPTGVFVVRLTTP